MARVAMRLVEKAEVEHVDVVGPELGAATIRTRVSGVRVRFEREPGCRGPAYPIREVAFELDGAAGLALSQKLGIGRVYAFTVSEPGDAGPIFGVHVDVPEPRS